MSMKIAAFFDFDETLLEKESGRIGFEWLMHHKMVSPGFLFKIIAANALYRIRLVSEQRMVKIMVTYYKGKTMADYEAGAEEFYHTYLKPHLSPVMLSIVAHHKKEGHRLILISGSVRYLLEPVARNLGFQHILSTDLEVDENGLMTGKPKGRVCVGENKKRLAFALAGQLGIDLGASYAYGNHQSDIPLLESVGHPHAVEPTLSLERIAHRRSWPILSFR
jgi:HAD superfamily hydrolase (TIGR01490 family)